MSALDSRLASGIAAGARPRRWGAWYVAEHRIGSMRAYWTTLLATAIGTPFLYLYAFGIGLAAFIGDQAAGGGMVDGVPYVQFLAAAMLVAFLLQAASEEAMFGIIMGFKWNRFFEAMNAAPITAHQIIDGTIIMVVVRLAGTGLIYWVIGAFVFGAFPSALSFLAIPAAILTALAFALPIMAYSTRLEEDRGQFAVINRVLILPLTLFSGTVFPLEVLPVWLQWIGWLSPLWHGSQLARQASYGLEEPAWLTAVHIVYLLALAVTGWLLARRFARARLDK